MNIYQNVSKIAGKVYYNAKWYCDLRINGKRSKVGLFKDERRSRQYADRLNSIVGEYESGGFERASIEWLNQLSEPLQKRLADIGLISRSRLAQRQEIAKHIDDWRQALLDGGTGQLQANQNHRRVSRIFEQAKFGTLVDISAAKTMNIIGSLQKIVHKRCPKTQDIETFKRGPTASLTKLHHLRAVKQFTKWCLVNGRITEDPLQHLTLKNVRVEKQRRPLTTDEISYLLAEVQRFKKRGSASGHERALIYELAVSTGLRKEEIASLKRTSFDFKRSLVRVDAADTKNKKPALLPLKASLVKKIQKHLSGKMPGARAFVVPDKTADILRKDLEDARRNWIDAAKNNPDEHQQRNDSDFLKTDTYQGKVDFHSLRHTFGTLLASSGIHPKVAMDLMRHSDINLTMALYTHSDATQAAAAISALPEFEADKMEKAIEA